MSRRLEPLLFPHRLEPASSGGSPVMEEYYSSEDDWRYSIQEVPFGAPKRVRIVTIGAGASGINMIRSLRQTLDNASFEHVVYEKNKDVGGTWYENRYPGCRCDIPSHNYQFTWRQNPEWSSFFSPAEEIGRYLCRICDEEDMRPCIKTSHKTIGATWNERASVWELKIKDLSTGVVFDDQANFLIDACGILNNWKWPDIQGLNSFRGDLVHTANWPKDFDFKDKRIAIIGNGASGVQLLPELRPHVKKLHHFIRTPTWIIPPRVETMKMGPLAPVLQQIDMDSKANFTSAQIEKFKASPGMYEMFCEALELESYGKFHLILTENSPQQKFLSGKCADFMTAMLGGNERLCKALIPNFPLGCRRFTSAPGYLEAFREENVALVTDKISRFVPHGIELETGEVIELDAIICATGFETSLVPAFPIVGKRGNLQDIWAKEVPRAYMSIAVPDVPNFFKFLGPNAPLAHGSVFTFSEHISAYVAKVIKKCQLEGIKEISPSHEAVDDYFEHITTFMPRTAWAAPCASWYKNGKTHGPVIGLHPGSRLHFFKMLENFRGEDWDYVYDNKRRNRFGYLGNGYTPRDMAILKGMK